MNSSIESHQLLQEINSRPISANIFPSHFSIAIQLQNAIAEPTASLKSIAKIVRREPLVAAKIVIQANAANQGVGPINDIEKSIQRIGLEAVRRITLAVTTGQLAKAKDLLHFSNMSRLVWLNSIYTACATSVIARHMTDESSNEAFFAGLLLNIGAFYLLYQVAKHRVLQDNVDDVIVSIKQNYQKRYIEVAKYLGVPETTVSAISIMDMCRVDNEKFSIQDCVFVGNDMATECYPWMEGDQPVLEDLSLYHTLDADIMDLFTRTRMNFI